MAGGHRHVTLAYLQELRQEPGEGLVGLALFRRSGDRHFDPPLPLSQHGCPRGTGYHFHGQQHPVSYSGNVEHVDIVVVMATQYEIGVLGAGNAAEGIVHGILRNTILFADRMIASDPEEARRKLFAKRFDVAVTDDNRYLVLNSDIVILAVKPQQYVEVCQLIAECIRSDHLIVSIMAGVSTASLEALFPHVKARVIRAMPNLPAHVGAGMAGVCKGKYAQEVDMLRAQRIFDAAGRSIVIHDEGQMDAVTAVSGTGPAYFYFFVEAITAAGERAGLSHQQADILAKQACLGAAKMMLESGEPPGALRRKVTSPGGTTQAAMEFMAEHHVFDHIRDAVLAASARSREFGR